MDNQWHHHQSVQGNICPTCSNFHYPFCPPHSSMNQNPRFVPPQDLPFHGRASESYRLPPDPYLHSLDGYRDPMSLYKSPGLDRNSHGNGVAPLRFDYSNSSGLASGGDRNIKRMRVGDMDSGGAVNGFGGNLLRVMTEEDERRLNLIRNHGGASMPGTGVGLSQETGFGERGNLNGYRENRVENAFNSAATMGMSDFRDPGFGSGERRGPPLHPSSVLSSHGYGEEHSLTYGQQSMQTNRTGLDGFPVGMGNQHHGGMVRDAADRGQRYHRNSPHGNFNQIPQISQQGPSPIREVLMERNAYKSNSPYNEQRSSIPMKNMVHNDQQLGSYKLPHPMHTEYDFQSPNVPNDMRRSSQVNFPSREVNHLPYNNINQGSYLPMNGGQPPLPRSPPPPLPVEAPYETSYELKTVYKPHLCQPNLPNKLHFAVSTGFAPERHMGEGQLFPLQPSSTDKRNIIDASHLFKQPHRTTRPDHIVIILRGLPGSGKSYLAKMFRDLEVENGGGAPRIHSIDDYFMTEVEKVDENELEKSTSSGRGKKRTMKKVMEYCYEPEMEEAYRSSMLKAFKKTLDEGVFTFVIVDDRNLRVADFAQFWAIAKRSGYEAYLLEATYKDPVGCAARNVHGFTLDDVQKMAKLWEEAPLWYLKLDVKSLFHGDNLKDGGIQEVDMDTEDRDLDGSLSASQGEKPENADITVKGDHATGSLKDEERDGVEGDHPTEEIKELGKSKWSNDFVEDDANRTEGAQRKTNSLSGLIQAYAKDGKSVQWGDQAGNTGFTIGAAQKAKVLSLVIGPGAGYNLKSNPLPDANPTSTPNTNEKHSIFQQQLRAERESFKAIFDRRGHRIALDLDEE